MFVVVPDELTPELHQLDLLAVQLADDFRLPLVGEQSELVSQVDLVHHLLRVSCKIVRELVPLATCQTVMHDDKRQFRKLKRDIKRAGNKRRRQFLKRQLAEKPEEAPFSQFDFGRDSSAGMNALDRDATRRQPRERDNDPATS